MPMQEPAASAGKGEALSITANVLPSLRTAVTSLAVSTNRSAEPPAFMARNALWRGPLSEGNSMAMWRPTTSAAWTQHRDVGADATSLVLKGIDIDSWFFGVSALGADGSASPVVFPGPAGAFMID
jgi:hypothetical protein